MVHSWRSEEKFWELILSSHRGSEVANWWSSGLRCKHFHLRAPGYPLWYAPAVSLVSLAQGQDCTRLRVWNGLTLLLGSPQQAPSRCHTSVVLRLGILCISAWELPSRVRSPSRLQSNPPSPDISLTFQYSLQNAFSVPPVSLSEQSGAREQVESTDIGEK